MKNHILNIKAAASTLIIGLALSGCGDILDETPRSTFTPEFFKTEQGVEGGITALYASLRYTWGQGYWYNTMETGTDEYTWGQSADSNFKDMDYTDVSNLNSSSSRSDVLWGNSFTTINTASGILENGEAAGIDASLLAEANFFRAFNYFNLVQTFGGVPLDLGSGELKFNTSTVRVSTRNTVSEVYTKCIFPDLITAIENLPEKGRVTGGVTKTAARIVLAKAYLTYAWWLENPNSIPTYPECERTDPDGKSASQYFQLAYDTALEAIKNPGNFALQTSFYQVNLAQNDRNSECVLYADHTETSEYYNGGQGYSYAGGGAPDNFAHWMPRWNYPTMRSSDSATKWNAVESVAREGSQAYDRPWTRMAPIIEVFTETFADKTYDSRYDGTFTTRFHGNWHKKDAMKDVTTLYNANNLPIHQGDVVLSFLDSDEEAEGIQYPDGVGNSNVGAGWLPDRADWVIAPSGISRIAFPNLWKLGMYRSDNGDGLGQPNGANARPYNILKFSELYLLAAEAAVKGATTQSGYSARELVNVLRARAGVWTYKNNDGEDFTADYSEQMKATTPTTITIDYILDERSREFFGEGIRWWDLIRTQTWVERAGTYTICGSNYGDHTPVTYTRTITKNHYLRPIPSSQIDALEMTDAEKAAYQNPGY